MSSSTSAPAKAPTNAPIRPLHWPFSSTARGCTSSVIARPSRSTVHDVTGLLQREITLDQAGDKLLECMLRTANGRLTAAEALGHREFVLTRLYESA